MSAQRCLSMCLLAALPAMRSAAQEVEKNPVQPRFIGEVTANNVYVRSGPSTNYYEVARLSAGDRVSVYGEQSDWYAIAPPETCFSVIHKNYVDMDASGKTAVVNANDVLVRAGTTLRPELYAKQLKLQRGAVVEVLEPHNDDYLRIKPPPAARLYISRQFVARAPAEAPAAGTEGDLPPVAALTGQPGTQTADTERPAEKEASPESAAETPTEPGGFRDRVAELDAAVDRELDKPVLQRDYASLIEDYRPLAEQETDPYARMYAKARIRQLDQSVESADALRQLRDLADRVSTERKNSLQRRNAIRPAVQPIGGGFDAVGQLRPSVLFGSPVGPRWYRLVNSEATPLRTVGYVEIPDDSDIDVVRFLGRKVGVRARERRLLTGDVDPLEVFVVSELVILDAEAEGH